MRAALLLLGAALAARIQRQRGAALYATVQRKKDGSDPMDALSNCQFVPKHLAEWVEVTPSKGEKFNMLVHKKAEGEAADWEKSWPYELPAEGENRHMVDVGAGSGLLSFLFLTAGFNVTAVESLQLNRMMMASTVCSIETAKMKSAKAGSDGPPKRGPMLQIFPAVVGEPAKKGECCVSEFDEKNVGDYLAGKTEKCGQSCGNGGMQMIGFKHGFALFGQTSSGEKKLQMLQQPPPPPPPMEGKKPPLPMEKSGKGKKEPMMPPPPPPPMGGKKPPLPMDKSGKGKKEPIIEKPVQEQPVPHVTLEQGLEELQRLTRSGVTAIKLESVGKECVSLKAIPDGVVSVAFPAAKGNDCAAAWGKEQGFTEKVADGWHILVKK